MNYTDTNNTMNGFPVARFHVIVGKARDRGIPNMLAWLVPLCIAIGMIVHSMRTLGFPQLPVVVLAFFLYVILFQVVFRFGFWITYVVTIPAYRFYRNHWQERGNTYNTYGWTGGDTGYTGTGGETGTGRDTETGGNTGDTGQKETGGDTGNAGYREAGNDGADTHGTGGQTYREYAPHEDPRVAWAKTIFGIGGTYTEDELKKIWRQKMKTVHPDEGGDPEKCKDLNRAYDILRENLKKTA